MIVWRVLFSLVSKTKYSVQLFRLHPVRYFITMEKRLGFKEDRVEKAKMEKFKTLLLQA